MKIFDCVFSGHVISPNSSSIHQYLLAVKGYSPYRKKKQELLDLQAARLYVLKIAFEYECWLQSNGRGSSYSTFCDEYGHGGGKELYEIVDKVRHGVKMHVPEILSKLLLTMPADLYSKGAENEKPENINSL